MEFIEGIWRAYATATKADENARIHFVEGFAAMASLVESTTDMPPDKASDLLETVIGEARAQARFGVQVQVAAVRRRLDS